MRLHTQGLQALAGKIARPRDIIGGVQTIPQSGQVYTDHDTVLAVQKALKDSGYDPGKFDGVMGPNTSKAIKAMQSAHGIAQTGVIDYGVLMALGVQAPSSSRTRSEAGVSASAARKDVQNVADNAAQAAEDADTPIQLQAAAAQASAAADAAMPPAPPEVKAKVAKAKQAAASAKTPAEVAIAKVQVQEAAASVQKAVGGGFFDRPWWQFALGGVGILAVGTGVFLVVRRK